MKHYVHYVTVLVTFLGIGLGSTALHAQAGIFNPNDPVVNYDAAHPPAKPVYGKVGKWVRTPRVSWNTTAFKCYFYNNMAFRLKYPKNYDSTKAYPILIFFHGKGEYGTIYDNEYQLYHGGQQHANAVDDGRFNGFLLYPQHTSEFWSTGNIANVYTLLENIMIPMKKVDPFRVYVDGLSAGGTTVWTFLSKYPKLVAAITPISSAGSSQFDSAQKYKYTPIFHFQGGLDTDPSPTSAHTLGNKILGIGGNYKYKEFPDRGHDCWYQAWADTGYYPFYARAYKSNPWPLYGRTEYCQGETIKDTLGVTPGFEGYEWRKNGVLITGATKNWIVVTAYGTYDCRIKKGTTWSAWSPVPVVIKVKAPTVQPTITINGNYSNVIPAPDGSTTVPLQVPDGFATYTWQKEGSTTTLSTTRFLKASTAGYYKVRVTEKYGCPTSTTAFSKTFLVVNANGTNKPAAVTNLAAKALSKTAVQLTWSQTTSPTYNETGFEIYQATASGGPYTYVTKTGADASTITLYNLNSGSTYYYKVRAVNNTGASAVVGPVAGTTIADKTPPTAPTSLRVGTLTRSSVELLWTAATDDVKVLYYDVYINGVKWYVVPGTAIKATIYNLLPDKSYSFALKARDFAGNLSALSNSVTGRTLTGTLKLDPSMSPANAANFSIYVNMNVDNPAGAPWYNTNVLPSQGTVWSSMKNYAANGSGVSMTILNNFSGYNPNGMNTGKNSGVYPDNVMRSSFYCDKGQVAKVQIAGLSLRHKYSFVFFGSRSGTGDRTSIYRMGTQQVSLNASNNTTQTVHLDNLVPDKNGILIFEVALGSTSSFAYLNALVIKAYYLGDATTTSTSAANTPIAAALIPESGISTTVASVFPNPAQADVNLSVPLQQGVPALTVQLTDATGNVLRTQQYKNLAPGTWQQRIPLNGKASQPGLYFIQLSGLPDGKAQVLKVIKTK